MTNTCPTTPITPKANPYTKKASVLTEKTNPYDGVKTFCPVLLQQNRFPLLLQNGDMILL